MNSRIHVAPLTHLWRSRVPQFPGSTLHSPLSLLYACFDFLAVGLQNGFSVKRQPILIPV